MQRIRLQRITVTGRYSLTKDSQRREKFAIISISNFRQDRNKAVRAIRNPDPHDNARLKS